MSRFGARVALVALALLAVVGLSPLASADHAFSHRYIVYGKVVDANGNPVPNVFVNMGYDPKQFTPEGQCTTSQPGMSTQAFGLTVTNPTTNAHGEFMYCYHQHAISKALPGSYYLRINDAANNISFDKNYDFDPLFRVDYAIIKLDKVIPSAKPDVSNYTIAGRFFEPTGSLVYVEGNPVYGYTSNNQPVNVTFVHDGVTENFATYTDNYGDFAYRIPTNATVTSGTISVEASGVTKTFSVDPKVAYSGVKVEVPKPADPFLKGALIVLGIVVLVAVVVGVGMVGYRRMSVRREEAEIRAGATRKRSR